MSPFVSVGRLLGVVAVVALASQSAAAQVKPFTVVGAGPAPQGLSLFGANSPHSATGVATQLGKYHGNGNANVLSFDPTSLGGTFHGEFTFVAANGDKLACTYGDVANGAEEVGQFQLFDVGGGNVVTVFVAEFNPVPELCTGRFAKVVDGSFLMIAVSDPFPLEVDANGFSPPFDYAWSGDGWLEFGKKK